VLDNKKNVIPLCERSHAHDGVLETAQFTIKITHVHYQLAFEIEKKHANECVIEWRNILLRITPI
jgi:hypothetical protein